MPIPPPDFEVLFTEGATFAAGNRAATISVEEIGKLRLPTGQLCACDAFVGLYEQSEGFAATVPAGAYTVQVARTHWQAPDDVRVAAAKLIVRDETAVTWELAVPLGRDVAELGEDEMFGYGVDAGSGCFVDVSAASVFAELQGDSGDEGPIWDAFEAGGHIAVGVCVDAPNGEHNIAVFSSGWGDGFYPTWVGRAADDNVACFVTEFFVVPDGRFPDGDDDQQR